MLDEHIDGGRSVLCIDAAQQNIKYTGVIEEMFRFADKRERLDDFLKGEDAFSFGSWSRSVRNNVESCVQDCVRLLHERRQSLAKALDAQKCLPLHLEMCGRQERLSNA